MNFISYIIGILTGLFFSILIRKKETQISRVFDQIDSNLKRSEAGAAIFYPVSPQAEAIADVIREDEEKGTDTKMSEL